MKTAAAAVNPGTRRTSWAPRVSLRLVENFALAIVIGLMTLLPVLEMLLRVSLHSGLAASASLVQHLTLVMGMIGAAIAARENRLLALSSIQLVISDRAGRFARIASGSVATLVAMLLAVAATQFVLAERAGENALAYGIPIWVVQAAIPAGFALMALRISNHAADHRVARLLVFFVALAGLLAMVFAIPPTRPCVVATLCLLVAATILGAPIFVMLGGAALILFWGAGLPIASIPIDHYRLVVNPSLPAIPLFTLAGHFLAEGNAPQRLVRVCRALLGGIPGGVAAATVLVSAFFTAFTGASGVTILALGGLLVPLLKGVGHSDRSALGLVTSSGSLGVLLPPSLPLILYAIVAKVPMADMFLGALLPGLLMAGLLGLWGWYSGRGDSGRAEPFELREASAAIVAAKWELLLPAVAFVALFGGFATPVEAAALTAAYAFVAETFINREIRGASDVLRVMVECGLLIGGVLLILGVALGFTNYLVDAQIPERAAHWAQHAIHSRWLFLAVLNVFLLAVGSLMEIFAAIIVVAPLLVPVGLAFGLDPVQLGVIFLANMELGFLTPLVGINIFLASYRFGKPVMEVCRAVASYFLVMAAGVIAITYLPGLTGILHRLAH